MDAERLITKQHMQTGTHSCFSFLSVDFSSICTFIAQHFILVISNSYFISNDQTDDP